MKIQLNKLTACLLGTVILLQTGISGEQPVITSFSQNGELVCSNLAVGSVGIVEWAALPNGPWTNTWAGLNGVVPDSNGTIRVSVPMFYRVREGFVGTVPIPGGLFTMGDTLDGLSDAAPISVTVSGFYMDANLVSYSQWQAVYNWATNHGYGFVHAGLGKASNHPVQTVDWFDCVKWSNARSQQAGLVPVYYTDAGLTQVYTNDEVAIYINWAASGYRLPTEAEWEKAARGGLSGQRFPWGNTISGSQANYQGTTGAYGYDLGPAGFNTIWACGGMPYTSQVGFFAANGYGLYDMAGNVFEWCGDWYGTPYGQPTTTNPTGASTGNERVLRGDDFSNYATYARCAFRNKALPNVANISIGFRCVKGL